MSILKYLMFLLAPGTVVVGLSLGGGWIYLPPLYAFLILPLIDVVFGDDVANPYPGDRDAGASQADAVGVHRFLLWVWPVLALYALWLGLNFISAGVDALSFVVVAFGMGFSVGGMSLVVGHELTHSPKKFERALAELLLTSVSYTHFCVEHVFGHHRTIATPEDPVTARRDEGIYAYLLRGIPGQIASAWRLEAKRMHRKGRGTLHPKNRMVRYCVEILAAYLLVYALFGWLGVGFFALQSWFAITTLETVNYLEHYGLRRAVDPATGRYERVQPQHSWNTASRATNWSLFNLGRHSDHHYQARRAFHALRNYDDVPTLPYGYTTMYLLALVPPLWFRVMNPRVDALGQSSDPME